MKRFLEPACIVAIFMISSCDLDPCKDYVCVNGSPQEDFKDCVCICFLGWDGIDCSIEDKCVTNNVRCVAGQGNCNKSTGKCVCITGYEGDSCHIFSRDKFLDNGDSTLWSATDTCRLCETCVPTIHFYNPVELDASSDSRALDVFNLRDLDETIPIIVNVNVSTFTQRAAFVDFGSARIRDLEGTISDDRTTIRVRYEFQQGNISNCSGKWTRL